MQNNPYKKKSIPTFKSESFLIEIVRDGDNLRLQTKADKYLRHWLKTNTKAGDVGSMKLELRRPKRSALQNAFYWVYLGLISESSGHTSDELHIWAKGKFLAEGITEVFGEKVRKVKSTTDLNRSEFVEFMSRIEETTGVPLPDPEPFSVSLTYAEFDKLKDEQKRRYRSFKPKLFNN